MSLLLGIDVGTSGTKGVLTTADGEVVATAECAHAVDNPRPGWFEQDPAVWWHEVAGLARELTAHGRGARVRAVCCSGMGPCVALADTGGAPLRPAILYGIDSRAEAEIAELEERYGAEAILARCGAPLTSQAAGPKVLWIRRHDPDAYARARMLLMPSSLAVQRLTGEYVLDHHSASQCTPLYDLDACAWDEAAAEAIAPGLPLPRLLWPAEVAGAVTAAAAEATGVPAGTPVAAGTIDAWAEAVSVGVGAPGDVMLMYGSTMFLIGIGPALRPDPRLWLTQWAFPGARSRAAGLATSGSLTGWMADLTSGSFQELAAEAAAVAPGAGALVVLPYFAGERTPLFDPAARGAVLGLHLGHGRAHLHRAVLEATPYAVRHNLEVMAEAGDPIERIVAVGGGTRTTLWPQIVADVTGRAQIVPRETVGASYGDARLAALAIGLAGGDWTVVDRVVEPEPAADYERLYSVYRRLYEQTRDLAHELAELQRA
jgi:xylulokinase